MALLSGLQYSRRRPHVCSVDDTQVDRRVSDDDLITNGDKLVAFDRETDRLTEVVSEIASAGVNPVYKSLMVRRSFIDSILHMNNYETPAKQSAETSSDRNIGVYERSESFKTMSVKTLARRLTSWSLTRSGTRKRI